MDSITQAALGAAVGEAFLGRQIGRKAALWGALLGTVPDLDVFIPMGDPVSNFVYHRSFSHSFLTLAALTPLFSWLLIKVHQQLRGQKLLVAVTVYAALITHVFLDCFTVYGTQIFWPFSNYPVSIASIFIIDPIYTLPLLGGLFVCMFNRGPMGRRANYLGLILSSLYLIWSLIAQAFVTQMVDHRLSLQDQACGQILVTPTPLNTVLWRIVCMKKSGYGVGYYSLVDEQYEINFKFFESDEQALISLENHRPVQQLRWFTHGFYAVDSRDNKIYISDIRMGLEPDYIFQFEVGRTTPSGTLATPPTRRRSPLHWNRLSKLVSKLWTRLWDSKVEF